MRNEIENIFYYKPRRIDVDVKLDDSRYYSGILLIENSGVSLEVYGEVGENRLIISRDHFFGKQLDGLECIVRREHIFYLYGVTIVKFRQRTIRGSDLSDLRESFKITFSVKYFYLRKDRPNSSSKKDKISCVKIISPTINTWLGVTKKQLKILKYHLKYTPDQPDWDVLCEFGVKINEHFDISLHYNRAWKQDLNSFSSIAEFPPYLLLSFRNSYPEISTVNQIVSDLFSFFHSLTGYHISIERAFVSFPSQTSFFPYYNYESVPVDDDLNNYKILMPYSSDSPFYKDKEVEFPIDCFSNYFNLPHESKDIFKKFGIYSKLKNLEEKFLGFYRVVERLTHKTEFYVEPSLLDPMIDDLRTQLVENNIKRKNAKNLTDRFKKLNSQKINSESAIIAFMKSLDKSINEKICHIYEVIPKIVSLRNDITHCNPYYYEQEVIEYYILVLEFFSHILLWREIGLSNHPGYNALIQNRKFMKLHQK
jgi:hypothetical protein